MRSKQELLDIIKNSTNKIKDIERVGDVPSFVMKHKITKGKDMVSSLMLYFFYMSTSKKPLNFSAFCYRMSKYVTRSDIGFKIDLKASTISMKDLFNATKKQIKAWQEEKKPFS